MNDIHIAEGINKLTILGDFNAHHRTWGSRANQTKGNILRQWIEDKDMGIQLQTTPNIVTRRQKVFNR